MTKHRVLIVDDNRDAALSMSELLVVAGFEVETCFDGPSALKAAATFAPEACLLDINMPGMDGYALARQIRGLFPDRPPLLATMTAYGDYAHLERAVDAGFDLQFTKPAAPTEVIEQIRAGLRAGTLFPEPEVESKEPGSALHRLLNRVTGLWSKPRES
ncbi:response regulator [Gemmata sp. G18]|uniref:Response regulator n=1 Tax=Gemmata palustris TaxID=2822762 RepID=A0ABS5BTV7_9BACT|nr:response regulator [Gemmata palustris]MBP3957159.1 response regulator [Gemmata palustris]